MSRAAKATLIGSLVASVGIVWGVHYLQKRESDTMYLGVLRDDARRREKMKEREGKHLESQRKRAIYESVQNVSSSSESSQSPTS